MTTATLHIEIDGLPIGPEWVVPATPEADALRFATTLGWPGAEVLPSEPMNTADAVASLYTKRSALLRLVLGK